MAPFIVTLLLFSLLIFGGVIVNLYLYTRGVVGTARSGRSQRLQAVAIGAYAQEAIAEDQYNINFSMADDETGSYARAGLRVFLTFIFALGIILIALISAVLH